MKLAKLSAIAAATQAPPVGYGSLPGEGKRPNACTHSGWTEERVAQLRTLWSEGLSASQIAKKMGGITRNSVIGKANRLGLEGRANPSAPGIRLAAPKPTKPSAPRALKPRPQAKVFGETKVPPISAPKQPAGVFVLAEIKGRPTAEPAPPRATADERKFQPLPGVQPVPFGSLGCKWPVGGDLADLMCCGARKDDAKPYCAVHFAASVQPTQGTAKRRANDLIRGLRKYA